MLFPLWMVLQSNDLLFIFQKTSKLVLFFSWQDTSTLYSIVENRGEKDLFIGFRFFLIFLYKVWEKVLSTPNIFVVVVLK